MAEGDDKKKPLIPVVPPDPDPVDEVSQGHDSWLRATGGMWGAVAIAAGGIVLAIGSNPVVRADIDAGVPRVVDAHTMVGVDAGPPPAREFEYMLINLSGTDDRGKVQAELTKHLMPLFEACVHEANLQEPFEIPFTIMVDSSGAVTGAGAKDNALDVTKVAIDCIAKACVTLSNEKTLSFDTRRTVTADIDFRFKPKH